MGDICGNCQAPIIREAAICYKCGQIAPTKMQNKEPEQRVKSTHKVEIVKVEKLEPHPNADRLKVVHIWGYTCVVGINDFKEGDLAMYIPPDSVVPDLPEFAFLKEGHEDLNSKWRRIRVRKFRGVVSQGLLLPAPKGAVLGQDVAERMGITHYEPSLDGGKICQGAAEAAPLIYVPTYDVDSFYRYPGAFVDGEEIVATEKIHGSNSRFVCFDGRIWAGSRNQWKKQDPEVLWWRALEKHPEIKEYLQTHPNDIVYAEVYGNVQTLKYGMLGNDVKLAVFDIMRGGVFMDYDTARKEAPQLPWVPLVFRGPYSEPIIRQLADGPSLIPGARHMREGIVVKPTKERYHEKIGRVQLKLVSNAFLEGDV